MLTQAQEQRLIGGGDIFDHYHSADRQVTHDTLRALEQVAPTTDSTGNTYSVRAQDDYLLVDTSATTVTVELPRALNGREITIVKTEAANDLFIEAYGSETINDASDVMVSVQWTSLTLKALNGGGGWIIV